MRKTIVLISALLVHAWSLDLGAGVNVSYYSVPTTISHHKIDIEPLFGIALKLQHQYFLQQKYIITPGLGYVSHGFSTNEKIEEYLLLQRKIYLHCGFGFNKNNFQFSFTPKIMYPFYEQTYIDYGENTFRSARYFPAYTPSFYAELSFNYKVQKNIGTSIYMEAGQNGIYSAGIMVLYSFSFIE
jgi:hypothetical protein